MDLIYSISSVIRTSRSNMGSAVNSKSSYTGDAVNLKI